jgi:hypothetical protein
MRLYTGAEPVGGKATGVGAGCFGKPSPGTRSGGRVVVVVGGSVVVVVELVVVELVVVDDVVLDDAVVELVVVSEELASCTETSFGVWAPAPPLSRNGPAPKISTSAAVTPMATAKWSQRGRAGRRRARRVG